MTNLTAFVAFGGLLVDNVKFFFWFVRGCCRWDRSNRGSSDCGRDSPVMFAMRDVCRLSFFKTTGVDGAGSPVACYAISQFHISSLSDAGGSKDVPLAIVRELFKKTVQPISVVHVKNLVFDLPELCNIFLQSRYAVESYTKKHFAFVICRGSILVEFLDKCMSELAVRQGETIVKPHRVEVETACFAGKETE